MAKEKELTSAQLVKDFNSFIERFKDEKYEPRVKDRKELQQLYAGYATVSNDDNSLLKEVKEVESLMAKVNEKMKV